MKIVEEFPHKTTVMDPVYIPLSDGVRLAARIWLPEDAEQNPVPAILEYLPYRREDGTADRDALTHPYFAGHGYACVRVDIRGSGDSEGILLGEYLKQEQDDALEIIDWITSQPWCAGTVGMIGISWGGFNGLQIAARRPSALKAIVSICSTDDRYADDIHHMGGCMLNDNAAWNGAMFSINTTPPDPDVVGNRWHDMWLDRLKGSGLWLEDWMQHQTRDDFYKHGSICENYDDIEAAVYAVGGWADGYSNAIFRLCANLKAPCKGLVGPWAHKYPHFAEPGPAIGFLQECIRWWDHWLKGEDTGIMDEPQLRCWIEDPVPPRTHYKERPGRWVAEESWPSSKIVEKTMYPSASGLVDAPGDKISQSICSPLTVGLMSGQWCAYGLVPDLSSDQRYEAGGSMVFDTPPLTEAVEILGAPVMNLTLSCDKPDGMVAVCLSEILPDGGATRVSYGLLNLTHRNSHEFPESLTPNETYTVRLQLNETGHKFGVGNKIRIAISSSYWPIAWPSPEKTTLTIHMPETTLSLPTRAPRDEDADLRPFEAPECSPPLDKTVHRPSEYDWNIDHDLKTGTMTVRQWFDEGRTSYNDHDGWTIESTHEEFFVIHPDDPASAKFDVTWTENFERGAWQISTTTHTVVTSTPTHFIVDANLEARQGDEVVHSKSWNREFPRQLV